MSLFSLSELKASMGLADSDTSQDVPLSSALYAAVGAVEAYCKRLFDRAVYTEYPRCEGNPEIQLRQRPVRCYSLAGSATSGATTITGLSSTSSLVAGMPAVHDDIPAGTTIASVASSTSVTISAATTDTISAETIVFGLEAWLDLTGRFGDAAGSFAENSRLTLGSDFELERDLPDGSSKSGILRRLGGSPSAAALFSDFPGVGYGGTLTARRRPCWPVGRGGVKAVYCAGYAAEDVPDDLRQAVHQLAAWFYLYGPRAGLTMTSESKNSGSESYSYGLGLLRRESQLGEVRQLLSHYREVAI